MTKQIEKVQRSIKPERPKKRRLVGSPRNKLEVENLQPGFHYIWVNDVGTVLQDHVEGGYEFVLTTDPEKANPDGMTGKSESIDTKVSKIVNRDGLRAFLMRIRQEWYDEDEQERQSQNTATLKYIENGGVSEFDGSYRVKGYPFKVKSNTPSVR